MGVGVAVVCVLAWLVALSVYDIRQRRLPNWLTLPGAAVILVTAVVHERGPPAALGAFALFAVYAVVHLASPAAMGAGDVKLAIGIGALTATFGADVWLLAAVAALLRRSGRTVPHGPSMCLAAVTVIALAVL